MQLVLVQLLAHLEDLKYNIDVRDGNGWTPLHIVTANKSKWEHVRGEMTRHTGMWHPPVPR